MQRKRYPKELKDQLVREVKEAGSVVQVAKRHGINDRTLSRWVRESKYSSWEKAPDEAKKMQAYVPSPQEFREMEKENNQLKQLLGEKDLKIAILTDLLKKVQPGLQDKLEIADNWIARGYAKAFVLDTLEISESTYYHRKKKGQVPQNPRTNQGGRPIPGYSWTKDQRRVSDLEIKEWLLELISGDESVYGYRKLTTCLRRKHQLAINKKKVYRLCKELDILSPQRRVSISHPRRIAINRKVSAPNQLWEIDIKYGYIQGEDRFFYFMGILDIYDRILIDYHIGLSCEGKHAAQLIQRALWKRKLLDKEQRPVIRTDNGPQFISHVFEDACETYKIEHERIPPKTPNKNAHIESFHSILERECFSRHEFRSYQEAYKKVREFIEFYNQSRIHGSLYDLSPFEFNQQMTAGEIKPFVVKV